MSEVPQHEKPELTDNDAIGKETADTHRKTGGRPSGDSAKRKAAREAQETSERAQEAVQLRQIETSFSTEVTGETTSPERPQKLFDSLVGPNGDILVRTLEQSGFSHITRPPGGVDPSMENFFRATAPNGVRYSFVVTAGGGVAEIRALGPRRVLDLGTFNSIQTLQKRIREFSLNR